MADRLRRKVSELPHKPGVYVYKDRLNRVIYVGKARDLHKRVSQYFHPSRRHGWDVKLKALLDSIWDMEHHVVRSEPEALLLEGKLIKEYRPKYNISFRDDKKFLMVKVNLDDPIPRLILTRIKKNDGARYFGPFAHSGALRTTMEIIKKRFRLRSCRAYEPGEMEYKHCLNHAIKICSAPCVGVISREDYKQSMIQACEALEGNNEEILIELKDSMEAAAARLDFEKATELRNAIEDLKKTAQHTRKFERNFLNITIDPARDLGALGEALGLALPPKIMECFDISNISDTHIVASMVCFQDGKPSRDDYRRYRISGVDGQNDFASMAEVIRRRYSRVLTQKIRRPDLIIVDGGKGQLGMAVQELTSLGLDGIPVIGLAKEFEEIHRPGESLPLRLPENSGALKMLQRIRDEAHRVANGYHQLLLKKRIAESLLDDIPGISQTRKVNLLREFGSIQKIRDSTPTQIAEVDGIGKKLAQEIYDWFRKGSPVVEAKIGSDALPLG
ncbi:MAG: excinuclease ABC subunit UvrC [Verrucomicrobiota bacterium]|nr:excinuclease ABC subunit UvrC [Verrucomicrobiota bacterium]